jgi:3'-phosphoadenosine 5'-phosphosulfate sulfotransferase (PAPS reductase)/FAD synthetase
MKETEYIESAFDGQVYVSFSGGKDSTVLADLCARVCKDYGWTLYLFFANTGLEYPEIQKFVKVYAEWLRNTYEIEVVLDIVRPEMRFDEVIKKYGYPVISKEVSHKCHDVNTAKRTGHKDSYALRQFNGTYVSKNGKGNAYSIEKWKFLLDAEFDVSHMCCNVMKKKPSKVYEKETGRKAIIGTLASESKLRKQQWLVNGCNAFDKGRPSSQPLSFWTEQDILHYIKKYDVPYCSVYGDIQVKPWGEDTLEGQMNLIDYLDCYEPQDILETTNLDRTGCIFCMFGCHLDKNPNRFQRLKETHPRQYQYCIGGGEMVEGKWQPSKEGLGLGKVLDYIGVKYD